MQKKQKIIGLDFDDVLHGFNDGLIAYHNARHGTSFRREQITEYNLEKLYGRTRAELPALFDEYCLSDNHRLLQPIEGAKEMVMKLAEDHRFVIITARPETLREPTKTWLDLHFPNFFNDIHFVRSEWLTPKKKKSEVATQLGVHYFVEDSLENAKDVASVGIPVFLLDTPWNQGELVPNITRVNSWTEIPKYIL